MSEDDSPNEQSGGRGHHEDTRIRGMYSTLYFLWKLDILTSLFEFQAGIINPLNIIYFTEIYIFTEVETILFFLFLEEQGSPRQSTSFIIIQLLYSQYRRAILININIPSSFLDEFSHSCGKKVKICTIFPD